MYEIYHYEANGELFQIANVDTDKNLTLYKENQVSNGETIYIHCVITGNLISTYSK